MATANASTSDWQQRLKEELSRNKKQTALLGVLLAVGLFIGVKTLKKKPAAATAQAIVPVQMAEQDAIPMPTPLGGELRNERSEAARDKYIKQMSHEIDRDLFRFRRELYPLVKPPDDVPVVPEVSDGPAGPAVEEIVNSRAAELSLQSTIDSDTPTAVINGQVLGVGDILDGFKVVEIGAGLCVVEQAGVQVRLEIPQN